MKSTRPRYWRQAGVIRSCSSSRGTHPLDNCIGALRCTPGSVANPLDRLGLSIAALLLAGVDPAMNKS